MAIEPADPQPSDNGDSPTPSELEALELAAFGFFQFSLIKNILKWKETLKEE